MYWVSIGLVQTQPQTSNCSQTSQKLTLWLFLWLKVPPRLIESETSASAISVNEFDSLRLFCKVASEPQSMLSWRREDSNKSLEQDEQVELRFRHELERGQLQLVSIDSSELIIERVSREHAGAYLVSYQSDRKRSQTDLRRSQLTFASDCLLPVPFLFLCVLQCIASNGVQPGVSKRISVTVEKCRSSADSNAPIEPCDSPQQQQQQPTVRSDPTEPTLKRPTAASNSAQVSQSAQSHWLRPAQLHPSSAPSRNGSATRLAAGARKTTGSVSHQQTDWKRTTNLSPAANERRRSGEFRPFRSFRVGRSLVSDATERLAEVLRNECSRPMQSN